MFYGHGTGANFSPEAWELITREKYDLVSLDVTMGMHSSHEYHMGLPDAELLLEKLADSGCTGSNTVTVISHFSHNGQMTHEQLTAWGIVRGILDAYDGMEVELVVS